MKKQILFLLFLILLSHSGIIYSQWEPFYDKKNSSNALLMIGLKGKVRSLEQTSYKAIDSIDIIRRGERIDISPQLSVNSDFRIEFDNSARSTQEIYYLKSKKVLMMNHMFNDSQKTETIDESGETDKIHFIYNYRYNDKGEITEYRQTQILPDKSEVSQKMVYKYDSLNKLTGTILYGTDSKIVYKGKNILTYDDKGHLTGQTTYLDDNTLGIKYTCKYDDKGNELEHQYWSANSKTIDHSFAYKYDKNNNVIQKDLYNASGKLIKSSDYMYEYDDKGNWTKRTDYTDKRAVFILERKLEYY